jgi:hypothetical protein
MLELVHCVPAIASLKYKLCPLPYKPLGKFLTSLKYKPLGKLLSVSVVTVRGCPLKYCHFPIVAAAIFH